MGFFLSLTKLEIFTAKQITKTAANDDENKKIKGTRNKKRNKEK